MVNVESSFLSHSLSGKETFLPFYITRDDGYWDMLYIHLCIMYDSVEEKIPKY